MNLKNLKPLKKITLLTLGSFFVIHPIEAKPPKPPLIIVPALETNAEPPLLVSSKKRTKNSQNPQKHPLVQMAQASQATPITIIKPVAAAKPATFVPDMSSTKGFQTTCQALAPITFANTQAMQVWKAPQLQAWVICKDIELLQATMTWANAIAIDARRNDPKNAPAANTPKINWDNPTKANQVIQDQLDLMQQSLQAGRSVLTYLRQQPFNFATDFLALKPQTWQVDLDGNGEISPWEARFFSLPNRSNQTPFEWSLPTNETDAAYLQTEVLIKTDATDILWALSYHQLIEGLVEMLHAQRFNISANFAHLNFKELLTLEKPEVWANAHALISQGFATSLAMRQSALAETKDEAEWLPNPLQNDSAFPLLLDSADYETWGRVMAAIEALWNGQTRLTINDSSSEVISILGMPMLACPAGMGFDIPKWFITNPPKHILAFDESNQACSPIDTNHPASTLPDILIDRYKDNRMNGNVLRYLYWIN